jgi:hypothetical protein
MKTLIFVFAASLLAAQPAFADLRLTLKDGRVSIVAKDVTVRQILTEWMRVGQTRIVNVDRIPGGPVTLELNNVTETQALDVLLRPLSGYIAAPRAVAAANLSDFDRIIVMPSLATARPALTASAPAPPAPAPAPAAAAAAQAAPYRAEAAAAQAAPRHAETAAAQVAPYLAEVPARQTVEESPYVESSPYEDAPPADLPPVVAVAPGQANQSPTTFIPHAQETRRPGVLPNGIVPEMPKNVPAGIAPFGVVAVPGMMVPGAVAPAAPPRPR